MKLFVDVLWFKNGKKMGVQKLLRLTLLSHFLPRWRVTSYGNKMRFCRVYKNCVTENDFYQTCRKFCDDLWFENGKKTGVQKFFENCTFVQNYLKNTL